MDEDCFVAYAFWQSIVYILGNGVWVVNRLLIRHMVSQLMPMAYPLFDPTVEIEK